MRPLRGDYVVTVAWRSHGQVVAFRALAAASAQPALVLQQAKQQQKRERKRLQAQRKLADEKRKGLERERREAEKAAREERKRQAQEAKQVRRRELSHVVFLRRLRCRYTAARAESRGVSTAVTMPLHGGAS